MNILAIGDVVGKGGCEFLRKTLPAFKKFNKIDICVVNGENSAPGNGITGNSVADILTSGADVVTTGNHAFKKQEIYNKFNDETTPLIRPANFYKDAPGRGYYIIDKGYVRAAVINLIGTVYLDSFDNPFYVIDNILNEEEVKSCKIKLLDFHAEATSEKRAMGFYLDGRVSAVFGTHTHVQTSDATVLPLGAGYITDLGMTGSVNSVLGVKPEKAIAKLKTHMPERFDEAAGPYKMEGCVFEIDEKTGKAKSAESVQII